MTVNDVRSKEEVERWLRGPLVDALAPRCSYGGQEINYPPNISGAIAGVNLMVAPLRLLQTRLKREPDCVVARAFPNYPGLDSEEFGEYPAMYPRCGTAKEASQAQYGDGSEGFVYQPDSDFTGFSQYQACAPYSTPTSPDRTECYGPGGYIRDIWAAADYRDGVGHLIDNQWIDEWTSTVIVLLQLANMQTGCLTTATVTFQFAPGGFVWPSYFIRPTCMPSIAPKYSSESDLLDITHRSAFYWLVISLSAIYLLRIVFLQFSIISKYLTTKSVEDFQSFAYWLDLMLGLTLFAWFTIMVIEENAARNFLYNIFSERVQQQNGDTDHPGLATRLNATRDQLDLERAQGVISTEQHTALMSNLKNAFLLSGVFNGSSVNMDTLDMRVPLKFDPFDYLWHFSINTRGVRSIAFLACILKSLRYLQGFRPLATRYVGLSRTGPLIIRFFLVLLHLHLAFSVLSHFLFMFRVRGFETFWSSFIQLLQLLTGRVGVAQRLIEADAEQGSFLGQLFVFLYIIFVVLTGSSLVISVIVDGWENSTELILRRQAQQKELKELMKVQREAEEYTRLKKLVEAVKDDELAEMATAHYEMAQEAELEAVKRTHALMKPGWRSSMRKSRAKRRESSMRRSASREASREASRTASLRKTTRGPPSKRMSVYDGAVEISESERISGAEVRLSRLSMMGRGIRGIFGGRSSERSTSSRSTRELGKFRGRRTLQISQDLAGGLTDDLSELKGVRRRRETLEQHAVDAQSVALADLPPDSASSIGERRNRWDTKLSDAAATDPTDAPTDEKWFADPPPPSPAPASSKRGKDQLLPVRLSAAARMAQQHAAQVGDAVGNITSTVGKAPGMKEVGAGMKEVGAGVGAGMKEVGKAAKQVTNAVTCATAHAQGVGADTFDVGHDCALMIGKGLKKKQDQVKGGMLTVVQDFVFAEGAGYDTNLAMKAQEEEFAAKMCAAKEGAPGYSAEHRVEQQLTNIHAEQREANLPRDAVARKSDQLAAVEERRPSQDSARERSLARRPSGARYEFSREEMNASAFTKSMKRLQARAPSNSPSR